MKKLLLLLFIPSLCFGQMTRAEVMSKLNEWRSYEIERIQEIGSSRIITNNQIGDNISMINNGIYPYSETIYFFSGNEINSKLLFLSTDAVFEGQLNKKYIETEITNPVNYYGFTKLKAEKIVLASSKNNVVLRTAVIYGVGIQSRFTNWILSYLRDKKPVDPFVDQFNSPTLVDDLSQAIVKIFKNDISGLFHATGPTCVNRYDFALMLAKEFALDSNLIKPVTSFEKKQNAPRPISTCLDSSKLESKINFTFRNLKSGISFIAS